MSGEEYFGPHFGAAMWTGFFLQALAHVGWEVTAIADPIADYNEDWKVGNSITEAAWWSMRGGNEAIYVTAFIMWGIAFIKEPKYQRYFFQSMIWLTLISWLNTAWINIAMLVGGLTEGGNWANLTFALVYDVFTFAWQAVIYFAFYPKLIKYYKWDEQAWWNGPEDEGDWMTVAVNGM